MEDCEKSDILLFDSHFQSVKGLSKLTFLKYFRLGKWNQNKVRLITMIFKGLEEKKVFPSSLNNFKTPVEKLKKVDVGRNLSPPGKERRPKHAFEESS